MPEEDFVKELEIDENNLNQELTEQPSRYSWWGVLALRARARRDKLEEKTKVVDAQIDADLRKEARENRSKITEKEIASKVLLDTKHTEAMTDYLKAKKEADILQVGAREAFAQRKDCLISLAANLRQELDSELRITKRQVDERGRG